MKKIDLIGVQMDFGAGTRGVNMGPARHKIRGTDRRNKRPGNGM